MHQLTGLDTSFLSMETATQFGHVASLTVYDASGLAPGVFYDAIFTAVETRLHLMPLMRRRLVEVPMGLDHPYWIEDPGFDLDFHVRRLALPAPGDDEQLGEQVARLAARPLDRSRPLWELYVIEGLADSRVGVLTKIHHATIDGVQGVELLTTLLDADPGGRTVEPPAQAWKPETEPSPLELLARTALSLARHPQRMAKITNNMMRSAVALTRLRGFRGLAELPAATGMTQLPGVGQFASALRLRSQDARRHADSPEHFPLMADRPAPQTSFNKTITGHRRFAFQSIPIADAKLVKDAFGTTLNDVVMALSATVLREYLAERGELPADPLVAMVPVSIRTGAETDAYSNRVAAILAPLHTNIDDAVARLVAINRSMTAAKEMQQAVPADLLTDLAHFAPPALAARASRLMTRTGVMNRMNPPFNLVISNVPGPRVPLFTGGARLEHFYPVSTIVDGQGLNITVQSYLDKLDFGLVACRELVPDVWSIARALTAAMAELVEAAKREPGETVAQPKSRLKSTAPKPRAASRRASTRRAS